MRTSTLTHLPDDVLESRLVALVAQERPTLAQVLAHIAEVDARHLYLRAGYESMKAYCVDRLRFSEDEARKRDHAARTARAIPELFEAVADGRLHLTAIRLLATHLTAANAGGLIAAATHKTVQEIEMILAERFPQLEALRLDGGVSPQVVVPQRPSVNGRAPGLVQSEPASTTPTRIAPLSPERFMLEGSITRATHDLLRRAQDLLAHAVPGGDLDPVLHRALLLLVAELERRKYAKTSRPRRPRATVPRRSLPAHVRRAVWERDGGRCAFVGEAGHRCGSTRMIEFDHVEPVARGGKATLANLRLVCRAHNQYAADEAFGRTFMEEKRGGSPE